MLVLGEVLIGSFLPTLPVRAEQETLAETPPAEAAAAYSVKIEGVDDSSIRSLLERSSQLITLADRAPPTQAGLVRRIEGDFERFRTVLRSEGYYDSTVDYRIDDQATPQARRSRRRSRGSDFSWGSGRVRRTSSGPKTGRWPSSPRRHIRWRSSLIGMRLSITATAACACTPRWIRVPSPGSAR